MKKRYTADEIRAMSTAELGKLVSSRRRGISKATRKAMGY